MRELCQHCQFTNELLPVHHHKENCDFVSQFLKDSTLAVIDDITGKEGFFYGCDINSEDMPYCWSFLALYSPHERNQSHQQLKKLTLFGDYLREELIWS